jgi:hypothetical protein
MKTQTVFSYIPNTAETSFYGVEAAGFLESKKEQFHFAK